MGLLQGAGDALYSMFCSFSTLGARVASAYIMVFAFGVGCQAVWYAVPIGWTLCVIWAPCGTIPASGRKNP
jgi:Na+-driven multidrug efflux pump